jgi:hypothetical protein
MSDDFGTINVSRSERAREIEVMRQHYRHHRATLEGLVADSPTESLAQQYSRVIADIDVSLRKLDDLENGVHASAPPPPPPPRTPHATPHVPPHVPPAPPTEPGMRPLVDPPNDYSVISDRKPGAPASRVGLLFLVALVGLGLIGWLMWRASGRKTVTTDTIADNTSVTAPVTTETSSDPSVTVATNTPDVAESNGLVATPRSQDFGVIRKGTRAVRKFSIRNETDQPVSLKVSRSVCRCLYYQHAPVIPPKNSETLSITVDGAKAKAGDLRETVQVTSKDGLLKTSVDVIATVR